MIIAYEISILHNTTLIFSAVFSQNFLANLFGVRYLKDIGSPFQLKLKRFRKRQVFPLI